MDDLIAILGIFFVLGVPVLTLATRFALRPLIRDLVEARGPRGKDREMILRLAERVDRLERDALERDERLDQLADAELFRRQLEEPAEGPMPRNSI